MSIGYVLDPYHAFEFALIFRKFEDKRFRIPHIVELSILSRICKIILFVN